MSEKLLATYLNDHLAGSVVALELLEYLESSLPDAPLARSSPNLRKEISSDRGELEKLMARLDVAQSRPRKIMAWLAEKMTQLKLFLDDPREGKLRYLEILEAVSLGIEGKKSLWRSLSFAASQDPRFSDMPYDVLIARAEEQREVVESFHSSAAGDALLITREP